MKFIKEGYIMKIKNSIYVILAFICVAIGSIGIVLPVLPTTPFLLLATALFAKVQLIFIIGLYLQNYIKII